MPLYLIMLTSLFRNIEGYIKDDADTDETRTLDRTSVHHSMGLRYNTEDDERVPKFGQGGVLESLNYNNEKNQSGPASTGSSSN